MSTEYTNKLKAWEQDQVANHGLVDVKFCVGDVPEGTTVEELAKQAYLLLTDQVESVDVTDHLL